MPFNNDIAGGNGQLVRNWIQSVNYVAGVSGWRISKDGSAEFNNGTFRGSIEVGSLAGQHFWVNNPNTTDVIDVYNSANKLVFSIDNTGRVVSVSSVGTSEVVINGGSIFFEDSGQTPVSNIQLASIIGADSTLLQIFGGKPHNYAGTANGSFIQLNTGDTNASEWINTEQRGIQGALLQTDSSSNANQLIHVGSYSGTTDASGFLFPNHGAAFTPVAGVMTGTTNGGTFANLTYGINAFNASQMSVNFHIANTGAAYANQAISFDMIMWG